MRLKTPFSPKAFIGVMLYLLTNFSSYVNWAAQKIMADTAKMSPKIALRAFGSLKIRSPIPTIITPTAMIEKINKD